MRNVKVGQVANLARIMRLHEDEGSLLFCYVKPTDTPGVTVWGPEAIAYESAIYEWLSGCYQTTPVNRVCMRRIA